MSVRSRPPQTTTERGFFQLHDSENHRGHLFFRDTPPVRTSGSSKSVPLQGNAKNEKELLNQIGLLIASVPGWEVQAASALASPETFDYVIWNNSDESQFALLGNPIGVEVTKSLTPEKIRRMGQLAKKQGLRSVVVFTSSTLTLHQRMSANSASAHSGALVLVFINRRSPFSDI